MILFEFAGCYFKERYIKPGFSVNDWKTERAELLKSRGKVYREYTKQKGKFDEAYTIRREAEQIVRELNPPPQRDTRKKAWER